MIQIEGILRNRLWVVPAYIQFAPLPIAVRISFIVDTGCTCTSLLPGDVERFAINYGINYKSFPNLPYKTMTAGGKITSKIIQNATIYLYDEISRQAKKFTLSFIIMNPPHQSWYEIFKSYLFQKEPLKKRDVYSLLGYDVLSQFNSFRFKSNKLLLIGP